MKKNVNCWENFSQVIIEWTSPEVTSENCYNKHTSKLSQIQTSRKKKVPWYPMRETPLIPHK